MLRLYTLLSLTSQKLPILGVLLQPLEHGNENNASLIHPTRAKSCDFSSHLHGIRALLSQQEKTHFHDDYHVA